MGAAEEDAVEMGAAGKDSVKSGAVGVDADEVGAAGNKKRECLGGMKDADKGLRHLRLACNFSLFCAFALGNDRGVLFGDR